MKEILELLSFSDKQIEELTKEETGKDRQKEIVQEWQKAYQDVLFDNPKVEKLFKERLAPNLLAEGRAKERKKAVEALGLNITKTKAVDMDEDEWLDFLKKSNDSKTDDAKVDELNGRINELIKEKEALEDSVNEKLSAKEKEWKDKIVKSKWDSIKTERLAQVKDLLIDKAELSELLELKRNKKGFDIDMDDAGNVFAVDENGKKFYDEDGKPLILSDWIDKNTSNYIVKSNGAPDGQKKQPDVPSKDLTPEEIRLAEMQAKFESQRT